MKISYLDEVLGKLIEICDNKDHYVQPEDVHETMSTKHPVHVTYGALDKLYKDGYASKSYLQKRGKDIKNSPTYYVSFDGLWFHETSSYVKKIRKDKNKHRREIGKFVLAFLTALCLISTTYFSYLSYRVNLQSQNNFETSSKQAPKQSNSNKNKALSDTTVKHYMQSLPVDTIMKE